MSSGAAPISPTRFAAALESLPLENLHAKAAELRNSIAHLKHSNEQMLPFAEEGDAECREAMFENLVVINRMKERVELLRAEVERRGMPWGQEEEEEGKRANGGVNGTVDGEGEAIVAGRGNENTRAGNGRLTDEELRRRLEERMNGDEEEEEGVHL